jgi:hypothetical protein
MGLPSSDFVVELLFFSPFGKREKKKKNTVGGSLIGHLRSSVSPPFSPFTLSAASEIWILRYDLMISF